MNIFEKMKQLWNPEDDFDDYYDEEETAPQAQEISSNSQPVEESAGPSLFRKNTKIVNMNQKNKLYVDVYNPVSYGQDTRDMATSLINRHAVVLNLEQTKKEESKRILDFLSGVAFAQDGKIKRIATSTFMITPENVELTGEELFDELEHSGVYF